MPATLYHGSAADFMDRRELLNDEIADFINNPFTEPTAQNRTMQNTLFKPAPDHIGGMGADKSKQFGWDAVDNIDFELCMIDKNKLYVDHGVQRADISQGNINYIAAHWNWACVGALIVGLRQNGKYVVVEGQHRLMAAMKRREVVTLPCVLIQFRDLEHEAATFLAINTCRKAVSTMDKHRVGTVANDADIMAVNALMARVGISLVKNPSGSLQTSAVAVIKAYMKDKGPDVMAQVLGILREVQWDHGIPASTIRVMCYLHKNLEGGIGSRFAARLIALGGQAILRAERAGASLSQTPGVHWPAFGVVEAANKGLRSRFVITKAAE